MNMQVDPLLLAQLLIESGDLEYSEDCACGACNKEMTADEVFEALGLASSAESGQCVCSELDCISEEEMSVIAVLASISHIDYLFSAAVMESAYEVLDLIKAEREAREASRKQPEVELSFVYYFAIESAVNRIIRLVKSEKYTARDLYKLRPFQLK